MLGLFMGSPALKPYKLIWRSVRGYMRENPGPPTQLLWKFAVFRLQRAMAELGYSIKIEELAHSTLNCLTLLPADKRVFCASAVKTVADEDRQAGQERFALAGDLVWTILQLVNLELSGERSVGPLFELVEAGFRGASCSIVDAREVYARSHPSTMPPIQGPRQMYTFNVDGVTTSASDVARQIHVVWVRDAANEFFNPKDLHLPEDKTNRFFQKIYLHCEAAVLRVLLTETQNNVRYEELLREFESLIFPPKQTAEGVAKLETLKSAMKEINALFTERKELSWCRNWFQSIGHDETNPATLYTFARLIGLNTNSLRKMLSEIGPPEATGGHLG
jgi:hypothetical protein